MIIIEVDGEDTKDTMAIEPLNERKLRRHRNSYAGRSQLNAPQTQLKRRKSTGLGFKINRKNISEMVPRLSLQMPQNKIALKGTQLGASVPRIGRSKIQGRLRKMMFAKGVSKSFQLNAPRTRIRERTILSLASGNTSDVDFTSSRTLRNASQSQPELEKSLAAADVEVEKHSQSKIKICHVEMNERKQTPTQPHKVKRVECQSSSRDQEIQPCSFKNPIIASETRLDRACPRVGAFLARKSEHQVEWKTAKTTGIILMLFIFLVYPRIVVIIYSLFAPTKVSSTNHARLWMRILLYCNSVVNPFLYSLRHREILREFSKLVPCCSGRTQPVNLLRRS